MTCTLPSLHLHLPSSEFAAPLQSSLTFSTVIPALGTVHTPAILTSRDDSVRLSSTGPEVSNTFTHDGSRIMQDHPLETNIRRGDANMSSQTCSPSLQHIHRQTAVGTSGCLEAGEHCCAVATSHSSLSPEPTLCSPSSRSGPLLFFYIMDSIDAPARSHRRRI